jgi:hypothetical protein
MAPIQLNPHVKKVKSNLSKGSISAVSGSIIKLLILQKTHGLLSGLGYNMNMLLELNWAPVESGGKSKGKIMPMVSVSFVISRVHIGLISLIDLSSSTRRALEQVSQDSGCLHDQLYEPTDVEEWEDMVEVVENNDGPTDDLEISHAGGEYAAVREYYHLCGWK